ncbi:MAG TPA: STAS domain-containing protein, partial [Leptospiraceae bacterium]|nr:STAS domain-containing protein [Leptospiraceae bacterium]
MNIATDEQGTLQYMALQGKLDGSTASDFEKTCEHFLHMGARMFLLDARELDYISSSGVGVLIKWARTLERAGGFCAVSGAGSEVKWLLDFVGLSRSYPVFSSEEDARRYLTERHSGATRLSILT